MNLNSINLNIDSAIFIAFLAVNLIFGLIASRGVNTIRGFAVGDKTFNTATLVSTIVATWIGGSFFVTIISTAYTKGISFISIFVLGNFLSILMISLIIVPRMGEFLGKLSIAEAMGELYGNNVRIVTSVAGFLAVSGIIAIQLKIAGTLFEYALGVSIINGIIFSGAIITLYSSLGGIKSVAFTDVIQFFFFGVMIPAIAYFLFKNIGNIKVIDTLTTHPLFDYKSIFTFSNPQIYYYMSVFLWVLIPSFNPAIFQRVAMASDANQASKSFMISSVIMLFFTLILCWIGVLVLSILPNIKDGNVLKLFLVDYSWITGVRGVILAGIMAMIMSTIDSYINSSSILLTHDLRQALNIKFIKNELFATRVCSVVVGVISIIFAMREGSFLELAIWASTLYAPIVTVPFIMSVFGFRSSSKSVLAGMLAGFTTVIIWETVLKSIMGNFGALIPGILANLVTLFGYHYLFKQKGGWVGIKDQAAFDAMKQEKRNNRGIFWQEIKSFNLLDACRKNMPKNEGFIPLLGFFVMLSTFFNVNNMPSYLQEQSSLLVSALYIITLCSSSLLISHPLWPSNWKESNLIPILWNSILVLILICFSFLLMLVSDFSELQLVMFMVNIIAMSALCKWRWFLFSMIFGAAITLLYYKFALKSYHVAGEFSSLEFKVIYLLLLISGALIVFLKPRQEQNEATEMEVGTLKTEVTHLDHEVAHLATEVTDLNEKVDRYSERVSDQEREIERLGATAQKILNNVNHELRLPVGNVMNFAEMLNEGLDKFNPKQLKMLSDEVYKNSNRLSSMIMNMLDLATLEAKNLELNKSVVNLSELVRDRVQSCRKMYLDNKKIDFEMKIEEELCKRQFFCTLRLG